MLRSLLLVAVVLPASTPVAAEVLQLDPQATRAEFVLRAAWVRKLGGHFGRIEGEIERDDQRPGFRVEVRIDAHSLTMPNPAHAEWARSAEFFDAEQFPWVRFHAADVREPLLVDGGELLGELELRGVRRPQVLFIKPAECARPGLDCPVHASAELRRSDFGMDARRWAIGDRVRLWLAIRLRE